MAVVNWLGLFAGAAGAPIGAARGNHASRQDC
jgi:hypothetical protein